MTTRRDFLTRSLQAGSALLATTAMAPLATARPRLFGRQATGLPIVDTHQHLWDLSKFTLPWLGEVPERLNDSFVTRDFNAATRGLNVVKAVYMEVDVAPWQQVMEAEHVIALSSSPRHVTCGAVISGRPASDGFKNYIMAYKDNPLVKGVRQVLHPGNRKQGMCLGEQFVKSMQLLGAIGKSYDLCMRATELADGAALADKCPDTRFILDHCGNGDPMAFMQDPVTEPQHTRDGWLRAIEELAKRQNVICKISGIVARAPEDNWGPEHLAPLINHCLDQFGPERVVFGGDWPVCKLRATYRQWVTALKQVIAERSEDDQKKLLHDNAVRLYSL